MRGNYTAILTTFKTIAIKSKDIEKILAQNDWKIIGHHKMTNELFINSLSMSIASSNTYSDYNKHTLEAITTTTKINNHKNKG